MAALFDSLGRMFTRVAGRPPRGAEVSADAVRRRMRDLTAEVRERLDMDDMDELRLPEVYLDFWRRFGGEKALTDRITTLYPPDRIETTLDAIVFGRHNAADARFGIGHHVLDEDDPCASFAEEEDLAREEGEDAEGDDPWQDFADTLTQGLTEIASENLLRVLRHRITLRGCDNPRFRALLKKLESLYGEDVSGVTAPMLVYFGTGVVVSHEPKDDSATAGFDSAEREAAFRKHFPDAE